MECDQSWGKLSEKHASCSKFAPGRKTCWTQIKTYGTKTRGTKTSRDQGL